LRARYPPASAHELLPPPRLLLLQSARAKQRVKELGLSGPGKVRVNQAGCLDRCEEGPVIVVYPEEVWYTYVDRADVDEIIEEHLRHGRIVERLRL
jgi:(2Fe-2S) ferredoxin